MERGKGKNWKGNFVEFRKWQKVKNSQNRGWQFSAPVLIYASREAVTQTTNKISGCGEVWYRAWMGFKRPLVRIQSLGPKNDKFLLGLVVFSFWLDSNPLRCDSPVDCRSIPARRDRHNNFSSPQGKKNANRIRHSVLYTDAMEFSPWRFFFLHFYGTYRIIYPE